jgi:hypothetical protein
MQNNNSKARNRRYLELPLVDDDRRCAIGWRLDTAAARFACSNNGRQSRLELRVCQLARRSGVQLHTNLLQGRFVTCNDFQAPARVLTSTVFLSSASSAANFASNSARDTLSADGATGSAPRLPPAGAAGFATAAAGSSPNDARFGAGPPTAIVWRRTAARSLMRSFCSLLSGTRPPLVFGASAMGKELTGQLSLVQ